MAQISRKQFIKDNGATCRNWYYSWSFINKTKKIIIFGLWDIHAGDEYSIIFSENWEYDNLGHKKKAYKQSREHIRLIEEEGYDLNTFILYHKEITNEKTGSIRSTYYDFDTNLTPKKLFNDGPNWKCAPITKDTEAASNPVSNDKKYFEGRRRLVTSATHERNPEAREKCLEHYGGASCQVCTFDFESTYGIHGKGYIHVHHIVPLSQINQNYEVDPANDLIPVCPNCHAMIHRGNETKSISDLKKMLLP